MTRPLRQPLVVGNWKMNRTSSHARILAQALVRDLGGLEGVEVVVCPPFTALPAVADVIRDSNLVLGAQNMHYERYGAFTGEISPLFLKELGCAYVILGHSERRRICAETDDIVCRKLQAALDSSISPIVCIGETAPERDSGRALATVETQFQNGLLPALNDLAWITIAYEPVWAIGTGDTATPEQAAEVHHFIRELAARELGPDWAATVRIIYGGSVTPDNIDALMAQPDIDGVLVGGASLKVEDFARICRYRPLE